MRVLSKARRVPSGDQVAQPLSKPPLVTWCWWVRSGFAVQTCQWKLSSGRMKLIRPLLPGGVARAGATIGVLNVAAATRPTMARRRVVRRVLVMTTRLIADALLHIGVNAYPSLGGTGDVVLDL